MGEVNTDLPEGVLVVDVETTSFPHPVNYKFDPTPFNTRNRMLLLGTKLADSPTITMCVSPHITGVCLPDFKMLVGHNLKFDLSWLRRDSFNVAGYDIWQYIAKNATVWDTALAEYLCSGQTITFPSLEECCKRRGIPLLKSMDLGIEIANRGGDLSTLDQGEFSKYLVNDVEMTAALFNAQIADPYVQENLDWFLAQMEAMLAEFEIEYNGTSVDLELLMGKKKDGMVRLEILRDDMLTSIRTLHGNGISGAINLDSPDHVAAVLFGGTIKWDHREVIGVYKSGAKLGQPRYKVHKNTAALTPLFAAEDMTDGGKPSTSDEALSKLLVRAKIPVVPGEALKAGRRFIEDLVQYREISKAVGTTLSGIAKYTLPDGDGGHVVRPQMNNTSTATGRRSSSKPNGQNYPTNDPLKCKELLGPRKKGRTIVSIDFKQAEIMGLAYVANDEKLMQDIKDGVDIHKKMGEKAFPGKKIDKEERRIVKTVVFGTIYGGGVDTLAAQAGVTVKVAQSILDALALTYPASWRYMSLVVTDVQRLLELQGQPTDIIEHTPVGAQRVPRVIVPSSTGRRYAFRGYWRNFRRMWHVSMTQPKNYFIQGFATGDLVPICIGRVWRWSEHNYAGRVALIGAIHDSIVFEVDNDILDKFIPQVLELISDAGRHLVSVCHMPRAWTMPVRCDVETGTNLGDLKAYEYS